MNERDVALAVASGDLPSPYQFFGSTYVNLRVSGTGVAWRAQAQEFTLRDRDLWLSEAMLARIPGLPVVISHPPGQKLDGDSLAASIAGVCLVGFTKPELGEIWATARIIEETVGAAIMAGAPIDTSPCVLFSEPGETIQLDDDERLLIENSPTLLDHVALLLDDAGGVWSKGDADAVAIETTGGTDARADR